MTSNPFIPEKIINIRHALPTILFLSSLLWELQCLQFGKSTHLAAGLVFFGPGHWVCVVCACVCCVRMCANLR